MEIVPIPIYLMVYLCLFLRQLLKLLQFHFLRVLILLHGTVVHDVFIQEPELMRFLQEVRVNLLNSICD